MVKTLKTLARSQNRTKIFKKFALGAKQNFYQIGFYIGRHMPHGEGYKIVNRSNSMSFLQNYVGSQTHN